MRKLVKLMTVTTFATTAALQVTACKDNSKFDQFMNEVNSSDTAFFGFLGSADNEISTILQNSFDFLNAVEADGTSRWEKWVDDHGRELNNPKLNLKNIHLRYYQGPYHRDTPSDPINSFWNDKSISWQRNIFDWVYSRTENNPDFKLPVNGTINQVEEISVNKDDNDNDMFSKLPVVFIVSKGKLITAGQNWISTDNVDIQTNAIAQFVLDNLLKV